MHISLIIISKGGICHDGMFKGAILTKLLKLCGNLVKVNCKHIRFLDQTLHIFYPTWSSYFSHNINRRSFFCSLTIGTFLQAERSKIPTQRQHHTSHLFLHIMSKMNRHMHKLYRETGRNGQFRTKQILAHRRAVESKAMNALQICPSISKWKAHIQGFNHEWMDINKGTQYCIQSRVSIISMKQSICRGQL